MRMIPAHFCQLLAKVGKLRTHLLFAPFGSSYFTTARQSNQISKPHGRNILLMGPPGAGKTCVGRIVGQRLGMPVIDIDDDVLERTWGMSVADKLSEIGGDGFIEEEGKAVCRFTATGSVISLTGSNPLHSDAMWHLKRSGLVVYLDVDTEDIMQRLSRMKVNRIVGQDAGVSMREILHYRKQFYEKWLDARVLCGTGDSVEDVADKVLRTLVRYEDSESEMFVSTRSQMSSDPKFFSDVVIEGLAPDGGLYVPRKGFPKLEPSEWLRISSMPYATRAVAILENCIHPMDVSPVDLSAMVCRAYGQNFANQSVVPLKHLTDHQYLLELFHGPTASFKDLALQLMPQLFAHCLPQMCNYLILVATSGDTGSAVLNGFRNLKDNDRERIGVLVFFPENGVSEIQKLQMTGFQEGNAKSISVLSDFDFCQRSIKRMFGDSSLIGHLAVEYATVLSTANSINWARLLPQVVYHCSAYMDLIRNGILKFGDPIDVCIPTGNFGNAMSALYAKQMGIPIRKVICASNHNCIISDFIASGKYDLRNRKLLVSNSPAIDILKSSNLERFIHHASGGDGSLIRDLFLNLERDRFFKVSETLLQKINLEVQAGWCSEDDCLRAIREVYATTGYIMDTHTAIGKVVADRIHDKTCPLVICSTAHHGKFAPAVLKALQCQNIPEDPVEQLDKLCTIGGREQMHDACLKCMRNTGHHPHKVCQADYNKLTDEVETMIQDSFLRVQ
ncbi:LOW QUALITY PROTEIN: threonine synthase-like 1 [Megalobrama amblycephala]|uniref:LOW QUALITY PROTEIN: threonine synthase-like 1 n=1 Tax=Megalobrama amblycephala TaxID=75352 RepID=UPI0020146A2A|nr:LOW QUALITY PROTEIN: threonine synthase-like 1 [Megalobrama amblycephala]